MRAIRGLGASKALVRLLGLLALLAHGSASLLGFKTAAGIDLGLYPMLSLVALVIVALALASSLRKPLDNLFVLLFPLAAVAALLAGLFQGNYTPREDISWGILSHLVLSVIACGLLAMAAAQALLLSFGESRLRQHDLLIIRNLPPLETMEQLMFKLLWAGLIFLTCSIASGFIFLDGYVPGLAHHITFSLAAWLVFAVLMWGRRRFGWRGGVASRWTLTGFGLLALGYFGSKLVLEVIL